MKAEVCYFEITYHRRTIISNHDHLVTFRIKKNMFDIASDTDLHLITILKILTFVGQNCMREMQRTRLGSYQRFAQTGFPHVCANQCSVLLDGAWERCSTQFPVLGKSTLLDSCRAVNSTAQQFDCIATDVELPAPHP